MLILRLAIRGFERRGVWFDEGAVEKFVCFGGEKGETMLISRLVIRFGDNG